MSCHYSCSTCSSEVYPDLCLSCPSTRSLLGGECLCDSDYYEYQSELCIEYSHLPYLDTLLRVLLGICYYTAIGLCWLIVLCYFNNVYSVKARALVIFSQITAIVLEYRYRYSYVAQSSLEILSAFNFDYLNTLSCDRQTLPTKCTPGQNLIGPALTLALFSVCFVISYAFAAVALSSALDQNEEEPANSGRPWLSLRQYTSVRLKSCLLIYFDFTVVPTTLQLSRIAYSGEAWQTLVMVAYSSAVLGYVMWQLTVINSPLQFQIEFRSRNGFFFLYDQFYHLNYLDYLYEQEQSSRSHSHPIPRYFPHSNFISVEILLKFGAASAPVLLFEFQPQLFAYPLIVVCLLMLLKLGVFQVYERSTWLLYLLGFLLYTLTVLAFYADDFFTIFAVLQALCVLGLIMACALSELLSWDSQRQGKYLAAAFALDQDSDQALPPYDVENSIYTEPIEEKRPARELAENSEAEIIQRATQTFSNSQHNPQNQPHSRPQDAQGLPKKIKKPLLKPKNPNVQASFMAKTNQSKFSHQSSLNSKMVLPVAREEIESGPFASRNKRLDGISEEPEESVESQKQSKDSIDNQLLNIQKQSVKSKYSKFRSSKAPEDGAKAADKLETKPQQSALKS